VCNFFVLGRLTLGDLDTGLFFSTYFGYWLVGMAMLSVGMVASFLTSNLTVGFILGAAFNAPLVFAVHADTIVPWPGLARLISDWSIGGQYDDFGRGVISLSSGTYFILVAVVGMYLSMVLIGTRHWSGGRDGTSMLGHYLARTIALAVIALGVNYVCTNAGLLSSARGDLTEGSVSSLSADTKRLMNELEAEHTINIEAFISGQVPQSYAKTKSDLISMLKEFSATKKDSVNVRIYVLDEGSEESIEVTAMAEERYGIEPQLVRTRTRGAIKDDEIYLAAAFTCGLEKVVVPFFDYGIPVEYELIRSISTVARKERKKVGIVRTDAQLMGGFSFAGGRPQTFPKQALVEELEKQYDVEEIDPSSPIEEDTYDVMVVVQPSSLSPEQFDTVVEAVRNGQPTAIFEDPRPIFLTLAPATGEPKQPPGGMNPMMMQQQQGPQPKGDIQKLWNMLGLDVPGGTPGMPMNPMMGGMPLFNPDLAWQRFNPYLKLQIEGIPDQWVFCRENAPGGEGCINQDSAITSGLDEIFFPVPGVIRPSTDSELKFTKLVTTGTLAGTIKYEDFMQNRGDPFLLKAAQGKEEGAQVIAARITGVLEDDQMMSDAGFEVAQADESTDESGGSDVEAFEAMAESVSEDAESGETEEAEGEQEKKREIDVVYVADIDLMISTFLRIRARPDEDEEINWEFENVTFLLNIVDVLSGADDFIDIRKRKPRHSTLRLVELLEQDARGNEFEERVKYQKDFDDEIKKIEDENKKVIDKFQKELQDMEKKRAEAGELGISLEEFLQARQKVEVEQARLNRKLEVQRERLQRQRDDNIDRIQRKVDLEVAQIKNWYKFLAVALPPIPPLLVGLIVFARRRLREREGIAKSRLR